MIIKKLLGWSAIFLAALMLATTASDNIRLNVAQQAAIQYIYDLFQWEASNFMSKWSHKLARSAPWASLSDEEKLRQVQEFFGMNRDYGRLRGEIDKAAALNGQTAASDIVELRTQLVSLTAKRERIRDDVEETLEATISKVLVEEGLSLFGGIIFPPVDIRLSQPPKLLVTSPRDRIQRLYDVLLTPDVPVEGRAVIEQRLLEDANLAALVMDIGGLATYPASIPGDQELRWTLQTAAHEWLHHYFFLRPLGQNMFSHGDMFSLNETIANVAGREIGDRAYVMLGGVIPPEVNQEEKALEAGELGSQVNGGPRFDFDREMRETRLRVEELLEEGKIDEAEQYMEERRRVFLEHGYFIRKLNQAYFAFHGTYADSPASISPIGQQVEQFRALTPGLGEFIKTVARFSTYQQFVDALEQLMAQQKQP